MQGPTRARFVSSQALRPGRRRSRCFKLPAIAWWLTAGATLDVQRSDKPESGCGYDVLADDLQRVMDQCDLQDATLVGFSMGGGEVAR